jgi:hypothetical protein
MGLKAFTSLAITLKSLSQIVLPDKYVPGAAANQQQTVYVNDFAVEDALGSGDSPEPAEICVLEETIDGTGSYNLDLTDAPIIGAVDGSGDPTATEDLTDKKLCYIEIHAGASNSGVITVGPGSSNGYDLFGSGNEVEVPAGAHLVLYVTGSDLDAVGATDATIDFTGAEDDTFDAVLVFE